MLLTSLSNLFSTPGGGHDSTPIAVLPGCEATFMLDVGISLGGFLAVAFSCFIRFLLNGDHGGENCFTL
jgi:hypothetical protein